MKFTWQPPYPKLDTSEISRTLAAKIDDEKDALIREAFLRRDIPLWNLSALVNRGHIYITPNGECMLKIDGTPALQWRVKDFELEYEFLDEATPTPQA